MTELEVCGTREQLITALSEATDKLQNQDTTELIIAGEGEAPDLKLHFRHTAEQRPTPWVRVFSE